MAYLNIATKVASISGKDCLEGIKPVGHKEGMYMLNMCMGFHSKFDLERAERLIRNFLCPGENAAHALQPAIQPGERDIREAAAFHMGDAREIKRLLATSEIGRRVVKAELGALGATQVTTWATRIGGRLELHASNGGESAYLYPPETPREFHQRQCRHATYRDDGVYGFTCVICGKPGLTSAEVNRPVSHSDGGA